MGLVGWCRRRLSGIVAGVRRALGVRLWARPPAMTHATGTGTDLLRTRAQLLAENALLRQQLIVLRRGVKRPAMTKTDRALLVLLAGRVRAWREALLVVQPDTLLRRHHAGFRALCDGGHARGRDPTDAWVAQQLREATPFGQHPRYLIRDNNGTYGQAVTRVAAASGMAILRTPVRAPRANAV